MLIELFFQTDSQIDVVLKWKLFFFIRKELVFLYAKMKIKYNTIYKI